MKMKLKRQWILMACIVSAVAATALFMIFESGEFYSRTNSNGYWMAALIELLLAFSSAAYFAKNPGLNVVIKIGMVLLFSATVAGATLNVALPLLGTATSIKHKEKLESFLLTENAQNRENLKILSSQKQKMNTAMMIRDSVKANKELKKELRESPKDETWVIWVQIILAVVVRFSLQFLNLTFAHILGVLWRQIFLKPARKKPVKRAKKATTKKTVVKKVIVDKTVPFLKKAVK